ncbi:MAG: immunoglobulin domain-containing protein [Opitutaceae bacterium]
MLVALLQRTPVLRVAAIADESLRVSPMAAIVRSAAATLASLGAMHSLAGATTFIALQGQTTIRRAGDPPSINLPATGTVGSQIAPVTFVVTGGTGGNQPGSFQITDIPAGLGIEGASPSGLLNASSGVIGGTPELAGSYSVSVLAWLLPGGPGTLGNDSFGPHTIMFSISPGVTVAPAFTLHPASMLVTTGGSATFTVEVSGSPPPKYQWRRNGVSILGATRSTFSVSNAQPVDAGDYSVVATNDGGSATSNVATLTVNAPGAAARLSNLSVRTVMGSDQRLFVGVVVNDGSRDILVRAAGPALAAFGLSTPMADPRLELFNGTDLVLSNNDWSSVLAPMFASVGAFGFDAGSKDAAFVRRLNAAHSIQAVGTGPGVVLVEAYDTGEATPARLVNVSARNRVGTGDDILIAGFNISGTGSKQLLIRAVGPTLGVFGVEGFLADPRLEIFDGAGSKVAENDNWSVTLAPTFVSVGAFLLDGESRDAALVTTLPPGSYTAQVRGADGGTGEALIEIYELP